MQNLQTSILSEYTNTFPKDTLKEISLKTGIQITRVFRIFNGSEMKISEYESFQNSLKQNTTNAQFIETASQFFIQSSNIKIKQITQLMKNNLKLEKLRSSSNNLNQCNLA